MPLDASKLANVRRSTGRTTAKCPACAEAGQDKDGNHLILFPNGAFGCVVYPEDKAHRRRIWQLAGDDRPRPLIVYPPDSQELFHAQAQPR